MIRSALALLILLVPMVCAAGSASEIDQFLASRKVVTQVFFAHKSVELSTEAQQQIAAIVKQLQQYKQQEVLIRVEGFASFDGEDQDNLKLSMQRALEVENYLLNNHNLSVSVFMTGFGEMDESDAKLVDRRRVDIAVYEKNSAAEVLFDEDGKIERFILR